MKRGQAVILTIFVVLVLILAASFYFYYSGGINLTGKSVEKKVILVEDVNVMEEIVYPRSLMVAAPIGVTSKESFFVTNYNDEEVMVSCNFPPFQQYVPSSKCFASDSGGDFITSDEVAIAPGERQEFTASVTPFGGRKISEGTTEIIIDIKEGEYSGDIELNAWVERGDERDVSVAIIPVRIIVEE